MAVEVHMVDMKLSMYIDLIEWLSESEAIFCR